jgi:hypothetical protein
MVREAIEVAENKPGVARIPGIIIIAQIHVSPILPQLSFDFSPQVMASHALIDAQFDRAVEIVQGLPKTGPIQTDYEEKLQMYRSA